ncbi:uncharacterized protein SCDLUD_005115 [Saccharomycodes ludwigii]|uniref:uncharacterized protein n=1 Tax=Saccharomycodes ludwigii TaxID=36035 RepID=UPI001E82D912|nr:hypothetical protein SCDLUD_005115 [Saccharomycodes ludwigii]KAH3898780.1 hypothetical protein SCDLUD_005115 [Saccharomycodes ludwigii]
MLTDKRRLVTLLTLLLTATNANANAENHNNDGTSYDKHLEEKIKSELTKYDDASIAKTILESSHQMYLDSIIQVTADGDETQVFKFPAELKYVAKKTIIGHNKTETKSDSEDTAAKRLFNPLINKNNKKYADILQNYKDNNKELTAVITLPVFHPHGPPPHHKKDKKPDSKSHHKKDKKDKKHENKKHAPPPLKNTVYVVGVLKDVADFEDFYELEITRIYLDNPVSASPSPLPLPSDGNDDDVDDVADTEGDVDEDAGENAEDDEFVDIKEAESTDNNEVNNSHTPSFIEIDLDLLEKAEFIHGYLAPPPFHPHHHFDEDYPHHEFDEDYSHPPPHWARASHHSYKHPQNGFSSHEEVDSDEEFVPSSRYDVRDGKFKRRRGKGRHARGHHKFQSRNESPRPRGHHYSDDDDEYDVDEMHFRKGRGRHASSRHHRFRDDDVEYDADSMHSKKGRGHHVSSRHHRSRDEEKDEEFEQESEAMVNDGWKAKKGHGCGKSGKKDSDVPYPHSAEEFESVSDEVEGESRKHGKKTRKHYPSRKSFENQDLNDDSDDEKHSFKDKIETQEQIMLEQLVETSSWGNLKEALWRIINKY